MAKQPKKTDIPQESLDTVLASEQPIPGVTQSPIVTAQFQFDPGKVHQISGKRSDWIDIGGGAKLKNN